MIVRLVIVTTILLVMTVGRAQPIPEKQVPTAAQQQTYDQYMKKHRNLNTIGWVMLGGGLGLVALGWETSMGSIDVNGSDTYGAILVGVGVVSFWGSIPVFVAASKAKKQARLTIKPESLSLGSHRLPNTQYTAFALQISL